MNQHESIAIKSSVSGPSSDTPSNDIRPQPPSPPDAPLLKRIFIGPEGLRAGWSILLFLLLVVSLSRLTTFVVHHLHLIPATPKDAHTPANQAMAPVEMLRIEAISFFLIAIATWIMSKVERRPLAAYGFGGPRKLSRLFTGLAWGVSCLSLLVLTLWKTGLLAFDARLLFGNSILRYGAIWLVGFLLVALFEESATRGFLQYTLARGLTAIYRALFKTPHSAALGFWTAALILSTLFGLGHGSNPGESPIGLLSAGTAALVFCFSLWRTGSLWWAIGFHATWDWAQSFLYGVADSGTMVQFHLLASHPTGKPLLSGGSTGPEGSLYILPILTIVAVIILITLPRTQRHQPFAS